MSPDDAVEFLGRTRTALALALGYAAVGCAFMALRRDLPQWYLVVLLFFALKMLTDYNKCTISYLECKIRGVRRDRGVLNAALTSVLQIRDLPGGLPATVSFAAAAAWYFFLVRKQRFVI